MDENVIKLIQNSINIKNNNESINEYLNRYGVDNFITALAEIYWDNISEVSNYFKNNIPQNNTSKNERVIALYYNRIYNGGTERVVSVLSNKLSNIIDSNNNCYKYHVVLITDNEKTPYDYDLDDKVVREYLPDFYSYTHKNYYYRCQAWQNIIDKYDIDIVISSAWIYTSTFWDALAVKLSKKQPAFCIHQHAYAGNIYMFSHMNPYEIFSKYQICDGIVTLSNSDCEYAKTYNNNVVNIDNPWFIDPCKTPEKNYKGFNILWLGRISYEKRPEDAIEVMHYVVKQIPEAKLYMVGSSTEISQKEIDLRVKKYNLENNIIMPGFTKNIEYYYNLANVFMVTSESEGYSMVMGESLTYGVPVITYDLPWLSHIEDGRGIITVEHGNYKKMAEEVVALLRDNYRLKEVGKKGKIHAIEAFNKDIYSEWSSFIHNSIHNNNINKLNDVNHINYYYVAKFDNMARRDLINKNIYLQSKLKEQSNYQKKFYLNIILQKNVVIFGNSKTDIEKIKKININKQIIFINIYNDQTINLTTCMNYMKENKNKNNIYVMMVSSAYNQVKNIFIQHAYKEDDDFINGNILFL